MNIFKRLFNKKTDDASWADPISSNEFKKLLTKHFAPRIRELGWTGTGYHYLNFNYPPFIYALGFKPNKYGGEIYAEIGIHLDFIPIESLSDFKNLQHSYLDIRQRLTPNNENDYWWKYENTEKKNLNVIDSIWKVFSTKGDEYFRTFKTFPGIFEKITIDDIENRKNEFIRGIKMPSDIGTALLLARINYHIGNKQKAKDFAQYGMTKIEGRYGAGLITEFEKIINDVS